VEEGIGLKNRKCMEIQNENVGNTSKRIPVPYFVGVPHHLFHLY